jgi:hypothetical protein
MMLWVVACTSVRCCQLCNASYQADVTTHTYMITYSLSPSLPYICDILSSFLCGLVSAWRVVEQAWSESETEISETERPSS